MILYTIAALFQQLIASGTHLVAKSITNELPPPAILLYRAIIASIVYLVFILIKRKKVAKIEKKDILYIALLGLLNIPINQFLFVSGIKLTTAPNVSLAYALTPAFVFIIAATFLKEKFTKLKTIGIFLAIAGAVVILSEKGFDFSSDSQIGDLMALTASFSWALYTIIGKRLSRKYGAIYVTGLAMIAGLFLYTPIYFLIGDTLTFAEIQPIHWVQLVYLGAITSGVGYALWYVALTKIDASKLAVFNNLQPVLTTILSFFIFGTLPTWYLITGGVMIISGVVITQRG